MKRNILFLTSIFAILMVSATSALGVNDFLGIWTLNDRSNHIEIIREGELYYIIEFVSIKHELFFNGDGTRAMFMEWGKGPGSSAVMLVLDDNLITRQYFSEEFRWVPSKYIYYKNIKSR